MDFIAITCKIKDSFVIVTNFYAFSCVFIKILPGPEVIKLFPCSTQPIRKFILLINVKMPTIVGILHLFA